MGQDEVLAKIAKSVLNVDTLENRGRDALDFHRVAVWSLRRALEDAYQQGASAARRKAAGLPEANNPYS